MVCLEGKKKCYHDTQDVEFFRLRYLMGTAFECYDKYLHSSYLRVALLVHQVTLLGFGHEAMSERKQLEEVFEGAPDEINGFWYTADELKALGLSDALVATMKDTTNKRAVNALIIGLLLIRAVQTTEDTCSEDAVCEQHRL